MKIAITADLHWGHRRGREETEQLVAFVESNPPDVLIIAGDVGTGALFGDCLRLFHNVSCQKALVPGNHDLWIDTDNESSSLRRYQEELPNVCSELGFHYLDQSPVLFADERLAIVGNMNWYDYSWAELELEERFPAEMERLTTKRFTRGRHNDAKFVRCELNDKELTTLMVDAFERQLQTVVEQSFRVIVVTHHPPHYELSVPRSEPPRQLDRLLWDAFCGNERMQVLLHRYEDHIDFVFCGHVHLVREERLGKVRGYNVGSDYGYKRLLMLDWPTQDLEAYQFGDNP